MLSVEIASFVSAGSLIAVVGIVLRNNYINDQKIGTVYGRLDDTKKQFKDDFVEDKMCVERQRRVDEKLDRVEADTKEIKGDIKLILKKNGYS